MAKKSVKKKAAKRKIAPNPDVNQLAARTTKIDIATQDD
jgi:hypothetical protein